METDIEAEVSSALALIENLSIKSSDSGLSEETCWQLFGGPCPEALRKKRRSTVERKEPGDLYFSAEDVAHAVDMPERKWSKNESLEHVVEDSDTNHDVDELQTSKEKVFGEEQSSAKEDRSNESNRVLEKFRNFSEIRNSNQPNIENEADEAMNTQQEDKEEKNVSSERQSVVEALERISGSKYTVSPQGSVGQQEAQKRSKHSVNSQKSRSSSSGLSQFKKHISKTQYSDAVMEDQVAADNNINIILSGSRKQKNGMTVSVESVNMSVPEKTFSNKSNQVNFFHDKEQQTVGVNKQSSGILNHVQKNSEDPIVDREAKSTNESKTRVGPINISSTTSSLSNEKPIRQLYSSLDSGESSEYESSIISDLYKRSKCRKDNLCNCRCCVERRIHLTYRQNHSGYGRGNLKNNFRPSQKPLENSNEKFKINIFQDNIPNNYKGDSSSFFKITSFANNMFDTTVKQCNKRLQTSEIKVQEEPSKCYHSVYIPCNRNPLYKDPMYMKPQNAKIGKKNLRKPTEYCASQTLVQSSTETDSIIESNRCHKNNYTRLEKDAPNIVDSLRSALKNRSTVRETVSKFEERHRPFENNHFINNARANNICQQKSRFTTVDICNCCNKPRNDRSRGPRIPASHLPEFNQW